MSQSRWELALIAFSIVLTLLLSVRNPLFEPPDELLHYRYVRHLITERTLPVQEADGEQSHSHHPPLYYLLGALLTSAIDDDETESEINPYWTSYRRDEVHRDNKNRYIPNAAHAFPWQGTALVVHVLRAYSAALFAGTLLLVREIGRFLWPKNGAKRLLMLAFVACNPMLIYISSSVNNDNLIILIGTALLLASLHALKKDYPLSLTALIAILWGLALLTKLNGLVLASVWGCGLLWLFFKERRPLYAVGRGVIITLISVPMFAWWFVRNLRVYGDLLGMDVHCAVWGCRTDEQFNLQHFLGDARYVWTNFWGRFGYGQINLPDPIYLILAVIVLAALAGALFQLRRQQQLQGRWFLLALSVLMFMLAMLYYLVRVPVGANARYVFPVSAAIAALLTQGLFVLPRMRDVARGLGLLLALLAAWSTAWFVPWTYAAPDGATTMQIEAQVTTGDALCWQDAICLLGHSLEVVSDELWFNGCWQAREVVDQNFVFFVHLLDFDFNPLGARDMHFGLGNYPTTLWTQGETFCERFAVPIVAAQPVARVEIGMYLPNGERISAEYDSGRTLDPIFIDTIRLTDQPVAESLAEAQPITATFEQHIELVGYQWSAAQLQSNQPITLRTYWKVTGTPAINYTIFAHLLAADGEIVTQADGPPIFGRFPTSLWRSGDLLIDERTFLIDNADSIKTVQIGFYDPASGIRLLRTDSNRSDSIALPLP